VYLILQLSGRLRMNKLWRQWNFESIYLFIYFISFCVGWWVDLCNS